MENKTHIKEKIIKNQNLVIELYKGGKNNAEIARVLIENKIFDKSTNLDSIRRAISKFLIKYLEIKLDQPNNSNSPTDLIKKIKEENILDNDEIQETLSDNYEVDKLFHYDEAKDWYFFYFPGFKPLKFTGTIIRDMKSRYSNMDGTPQTINEICRYFQVPRNVFVRIKTALGWTHDSEPFTDEEFFMREEDEMVDDLLQRRKFSFFQKFTQQEQKKLMDAATKWWAFQGLTVNPFIEKMGDIQSSYKIEKLKLPKGTPNACVMAPFDLHYGKYSWEGEVNEKYNRQIARELLLSKTDEILIDLVHYNIEKIIVPIGSDFFHIDTLGGHTTKGTPQDCDGTFVQIMVEGNQLMIEFIDRLRQVAAVEIILTAGNHDFKLSHALLEFLAAYYRNNKDVNVIKAHHFRQYYQYGSTLLGFTHGDQTKLTDLPFLMAKEAKEKWGESKYRCFFTGHLHHEAIKDYNGVKIYQLPSLTGSDRWHHQNGFEGAVKSLHAYLIDKENGVRATLMANV